MGGTLTHSNLVAIPEDTQGPTFVYILARSGPYNAVGPVKIGIAKDVHRRIRAIQTAAAFPLTIYAAFLLPTRQAAARMEAKAHKWYRVARKHGEWFDITPETAHEDLKCELSEMPEVRALFSTQGAFLHGLDLMVEASYEV